MTVTVEVLATSIDGVAAAIAAGADRIELCQDLVGGGTTPSAGLIEQSVALAQPAGVQIMTMLRPRAGGFTYSRDEVAVMASDMHTAFRLGSDGVVFGFLTENRQIDQRLTREFVDLAGGRPTTFHRAVDTAIDPIVCARIALSLGCRQVLTSGGANTAADGAAEIAELEREHPGRILAAGRIKADNVAALIAATGVTQVHASVRGFADGGGYVGLPMGPTPDWPIDAWPVPTEAAVAELRAALSDD